MIYPATVKSNTATEIKAEFNIVPAGIYNLEVLFTDWGYAKSTSTIATVTVGIRSVTISTAIESSFAGGQTLTIAGKGF